LEIYSDLNKLLTIIGLQEASKEAIAKGVSTYEDIEDLLTDLADEKSKVEATFWLVVYATIVTDINIHSVMFAFDWFLANIVEPHFA
jgi:hypothetical protein